MIKTILCGKSVEKAGELIDYNLTLEYFMVTEPFCSKYSDLLRYGIKIKMTSDFPDGTSSTEEKEIRDIFYRKKDAEDFIALLIKNKVTPTHFLEVVQEYISNKFNSRGC